MPILQMILLSFLSLGFSIQLIGQVSYSKDINSVQHAPQSHQLYPREADNKAIVPIKGKVRTTVDEVELVVTQHLLDGSSQAEKYSQITTDSFNFSPVINAGMYLYTFELFLKKNGLLVYQETIAQDVACGDVYIISGQSNAMGVTNGLVTPKLIQDSLYQQYPMMGSNKIYSKSLGNMPQYNGVNGALTNYNPNNDYWLPATAASNDLLGFVGMWGLKLQYLIQEHYQIPTCFINGAYGGTNLSEHQLEASATDDPYDLTTLFGSLSYRIKKANVKHKIKGVIWYQGESQNTYERAHSYTDSLNYLIDNWEEHWGSFEKIYVVQIHTGCNYHGFGQVVREQQRKIQRPLGSTASIVPVTANGIGSRALVANDPHYGCHFSRDAYNNLADRLFQVIGRDFYQANSSITSPNIKAAYYAYDELVLEFDQPLADYPNGIEQSFAFYKAGNLLTTNDCNIKAITVEQHKLHILLDNPIPDAVSYSLAEDPIYNNEMIWLTNPMGYAAFAFHQFPIKDKKCIETHFALTPNIINEHTSLGIHLKNCNSDNIIKFYSMQGQLLYQITIPHINTIHYISLTDFPTGLYLVALENNGVILDTKKLVKH